MKIGKDIKCRCGNIAVIVLTDGRYRVQCSFCGYNGYLREVGLNNKKQNTLFPLSRIIN